MHRKTLFFFVTKSWEVTPVECYLALPQGLGIPASLLMGYPGKIELLSVYEEQF